MPSALETLVKILKLEREQGYKNNAVIGGLGEYSALWADQARTQARRPEHLMLIDELVDLMIRYESVSEKGGRGDSIEYMLARITGRIPPPEPYRSRHYDAPFPSRSEPRPERAPANAAPAASQAQRDRRKQRAAQPSADAGQSERDARKKKKSREADRASQKVKPSDDGGRMTPDDDFSRMDMEFRGGRGSAPVSDIPAPVKLARPPRKPRTSINPEEAADVLRGLHASVETIKDVGPKRAEQLKRLNIFTINDLLFFLPRRYDDYTQLKYISKLTANEQATVIGTVRHTEVRIGQSGRRDFYIRIDDGSAQIGVMFFGQWYLQNKIRLGQQIVVYGKTSTYRGRVHMANPEWEPLDVDDLKRVGIVPVYPLTEGLNGRELRRLIKRTVDYWAERLPDYVPEATLERTDLADLGWTIRNLHFPESWDHLHHARRRFVFDQLLLLQLAILGNRRTWQSLPTDALHIDDDTLVELLRALFPYELTNAQRRAIEDIRRDISQTVPMNRLLQGDVGSGKTAVAIAALAIAFINGKQAALMAPTGILAEQHYRSISRTLAALPVEHKPVVALLTSALSSGEREAVRSGLAEGSIDIVIGTHALIQEGVDFRDLALAIIDEQHRFGVEQRGTLRGKGKNPHLLVMTATPIPRTLALTIYADLDLSIIDEMPPGREPVRTRVIQPHHREKAYGLIEDQIKAGHQAFIVYPLVEASDTIEAESAVEAFERLKGVFYHHRVGLLHGRMKPAEKDAVMAAFRDHDFDILVTTSVAEVGVDIPNATVILIEGANRFGLAQLHQFRGRVGRGGHPSICLLVNDAGDDIPDRLRALEATHDGFKLAEIDWQLRGSGDLIGTRQSGQPVLRLLEAVSPELVEMAQREAQTIFYEDPLLEREDHALLNQRVALLRDERSDLS